MGVFYIFELGVIAALIYLIINLLAFFFIREEIPIGVFGLANSWVRKEKSKNVPPQQEAPNRTFGQRKR